MGSSSSTRAPLFRLNNDGSTDSSFTYVTPGSSSLAAKDLAVQTDGKLLAATGFSFSRFNPNGSLDSSFTPPTLIGGQPLTVYPQADGRILVGGTFTDLNTSGAGTNAHFGVARLQIDGTLDQLLVTTHKTGLEKAPSSFARLADGSTLAAFGLAYFGIDPSSPFQLARLLSDGSLDPNFSLSSSIPNSILESDFQALNFDRLTDGRFLIAGTA